MFSKHQHSLIKKFKPIGFLKVMHIFSLVLFFFTSFLVPMATSYKQVFKSKIVHLKFHHLEHGKRCATSK